MLWEYIIHFAQEIGLQHRNGKLMINGIHENLYQSQHIKQTKEKSEILRIVLKTKPADRDITHEQKRNYATQKTAMKYTKP
jgi:glutamine phosphoribosylpyrophosphate amidotransferase